MKVLVTGGAGYIGTHTLVELIAEGNEVVVVDDFSNSSPESIRRVEGIADVHIPYYAVDCRDAVALRKAFDMHKPDAVVHFAGLKSVGQSTTDPLRYYRTNIDAMLTLCEVMQEKNVRRLIFSSSATVYGLPESLPLREDSRTGVGITNPYGRTKFMIEQILQDLAVNGGWSITILRYFNPVGAHESGLIGEDPNGIPNNLLPYIAQVAVGRLAKLRIFGGDYDTADGTGVRDYIHVVDLAKGHVAALEHINDKEGVEIYNLGTGRGLSVFDVLHAFEKACGKTLPYEVVAHRPGDVPSCYADVSKATHYLNWHAVKTIEEVCVDAWLWQSKNPNGYKHTIYP